MNSTEKALSSEEKETLIIMLNNFSEDHRQNTKAINSLISLVKEQMENRGQENIDAASDPQLLVSLSSVITDEMATATQKIEKIIRDGQIPVVEWKRFASKLAETYKLLESPPLQKILHHHHVPKLLWVTAGLFLLLSLGLAGWYLQYKKLDGFIANDTKYRSMRLDTSNIRLQLYLDRLDSIYKTNPELREKVIEKEDQYKLNHDRRQRASRLRLEAEELDKKAAREK